MNTDEYDPTSFLTTADHSVLGCGSYATVLRCHHSVLGTVAVKRSNISGSKESISEQKKEAKKRIQALRSLKKHKNIISIFGIIFDLPSQFGIITEMASFGNLYDLLFREKTANSVEITWIMKLKFFEEIACGLEFLHFGDSKKKFIHKDLKSENILITSGMTLKIADFGSYEIKVATGAITDKDIQSNNQHTAYYAAPEFLKCMADSSSNTLNNISTAMDVYSYGMIAYEIITRHILFEKQRQDLVVSLIIAIGQRPNPQYVNDIAQSFDSSDNVKKHIFCGLKDVMEQCWNFDPSLRPSIAKVNTDISELQNNINEYCKIVAHHTQILEAKLKNIRDKNAKANSSGTNDKINLLQYFHPVFSNKITDNLMEESASKLLLSSETSGIELEQTKVKNVETNLKVSSDSNNASNHSFDTQKLAHSKHASRKDTAKSSSASISTSQFLANKDTREKEDNKDKISLSDFAFTGGYKMNHLERGTFIIFEQEICLDGTWIKTHSRDAHHFYEAAELMGFTHIRIVRNLTRRQIFDWMFTLSHASHFTYDCFGCAFITFQKENDELYANDTTFHLNQILLLFTSKNCPTLAGKPKMFFLSTPGKVYNSKHSNADLTPKASKLFYPYLCLDIQVGEIR